MPKGDFSKRIKRCGAKTREGTKCQRAPMKNGRCYMHGGKSLEGPALPQYKTGRHSHVLPKDLRERYEAGLTAEQLLNLAHEISLIDQMIYDAMARSNMGASEENWLRLIALQEEIDEHMANRAIPEAMACRDQMRSIIREEKTALAMRFRVDNLVDKRRKLVDSETRRLTNMREIMTADQALVLIDQVLSLVTEHVTDRAALSAIATGIRALQGAEA